MFGSYLRVKAEIAKKTFSQAKFVRSADDRTLLPANSVTTVMTNGGPTSSDDPVMIQHLVYNEHLPRGVMDVDTLTSKKNGMYPVHVANLGQTDVWLNKGVRVGMIKEVDVICDSDSDTCIEEMGVNEIFVRRQEVVCVGKDWEGIKLPEVDTSRFDETESEKIRNFLKRHASSFPREDEIGFSDTVRHKVNTYDDSPVSQPYRRIPPNQLMEVKAHIQKLLD